MISVVIPTRGRGVALERCLRALGRQQGAGDFEAVVSFDGEDATGAAAAASLGRELGLRTRVVEGVRRGVGAAKNRALGLASGDLVVFLNDDVVPAPTLLAAHRARHSEAAGPALMVVGHSPLERGGAPSRFDALTADTSAVFFYDRMGGRSRGFDFGFRHAWNLNLSVEAARLRETGPFCELDHPYGYEDLELAFRFVARWGAHVVYEPEARASHEHAMTPDAYLERELGLGYCAPSLAMRNGACARAIFGRDILDPAEVERDRAAVRRDRCEAVELTAWLRSLAREAWSSATQTALDYERHLTLKRHCWRAGRLTQAAGLEAPPSLRGLGLGAPARSAG